MKSLAQAVTVTSPSSVLAVVSSASAPWNGGSIMSATLPSANANAVILAIVTGGLTFNAVNQISVSDAAGLAWTRKAVIIDPVNFDFAVLFSAVAPSAFNNDVVTARSIFGPAGSNVYSGRLSVVATTGAAFDSNASLPAADFCNTGCINPSLPYSTTNPNALLIAAAWNAGGQGLDPPSSWTTIVNDVVNSRSQGVFYRIVSSAQSAASVTCGNGQGNNWVALVNAVV